MNAYTKHWKSKIVLGAIAFFTVFMLDSDAKSQVSCLKFIQRHAPQLLQQFRYPSNADITDYWGYYEEEYGGEAFCARADFNLDGSQDFAFILLRKDSKGFGVFALVSGKSRSFQAFSLLDDQRGLFLPQEGRVEAAKPGTYRRVLPEKERSSAGPSNRIRLRTPGIDYFTRQLMGRLVQGTPKAEHFLFYWEKGRFRKAILAAPD